MNKKFIILNLYYFGILFKLYRVKLLQGGPERSDQRYHRLRDIGNLILNKSFL